MNQSKKPSARVTNQELRTQLSQFSRKLDKLDRRSAQSENPPTVVELLGTQDDNELNEIRAQLNQFDRKLNQFERRSSLQTGRSPTILELLSTTPDKDVKDLKKQVDSLYTIISSMHEKLEDLTTSMVMLRTENEELREKFEEANTRREANTDLLLQLTTRFNDKIEEITKNTNDLSDLNRLLNRK